eukprot:gene13443-19301_t
MASAGLNNRKCMDCGGTTFVTVYSAGDIVCQNCGLVAEAHIIDERSEWRTFSDTDKNGADPNRVGGPTNALLEGGGLSTVIGKTLGDGGVSYNLSRLHARSNNPDRNLIQAFKAIGEMCEELNLSMAVKDRASHVYKEVMETGTMRGRGMKAICAGCLYLACRNENNPRTFREITGVLKKDIGRCFKEIVQMYKDKASDGTLLTCTAVVLKLSHEVVKLCREMAVAAKPKEGSAERKAWDGKNPTSVAAAIIYIGSMLSGYKNADDRVPMQNIVLVTQVAEVTIRSAYRDMYPELPKLIPKGSSLVSAAALRSLPVPMQRTRDLSQDTGTSTPDITVPLSEIDAQWKHYKERMCNNIQVNAMDLCSQMGPISSYGFNLTLAQLKRSEVFKGENCRLRRAVHHLMTGERQVNIGVIGASVCFGTGTQSFLANMCLSKMVQPDIDILIMDYMMTDFPDFGKEQFWGNTMALERNNSGASQCNMHCGANSNMHCGANSNMHCGANSNMHCGANSNMHCGANSNMHCGANSNMHCGANSNMHCGANSNMHCGANSNTMVKSFERLIRKVVKQDSHPVVILYEYLATGHGQDQNSTLKRPFHFTAEDMYGALAQYYELPWISFRTALWQDAEYKRGNIPGGWQDLLGDFAHPNDRGHRFVMVMDVMTQVCDGDGCEGTGS